MTSSKSPPPRQVGAATSRALGLPDEVRACLFDLDGVVTRTAEVHAAAWQQMFDAFLRDRSERTREPFVPFDPVADYDRFVDGRPRDDGTRTFLASRSVTLPEGDPSDPPEADSVRGLGHRKNELVLRHLREERVRVFEGSVRYVRAVREAGLGTAVVSSSTNCQQVLVSAGIEELFDERVDGRTAARQRLAGKPAPDLFLTAAARVGVPPQGAAVFEDALAGVAAGRAGDFRLVVGVDRTGQAKELAKQGADVVVDDLAELLTGSR